MQIIFNSHNCKEGDYVSSQTKDKNIALCLQPHSSIKSMMHDLINHDFPDYTLIDHSISCSWMSSFSEFEEEALYKMIVNFNPVLMILDDSFPPKYLKI